MKRVVLAVCIAAVVAAGFSQEAPGSSAPRDPRAGHEAFYQPASAAQPASTTSTTLAPAQGDRAGSTPRADREPAKPTPVGTLLRSEPMTDLPAGMRGWRILYSSTDGAGAPVNVSGMVIRPEVQAPAGGFPVIAWAHSTVGVADGCTPSKGGTPPGLNTPSVLAAGYAIVATDYLGMGDPNLVHPYLDGVAEAHSVLDAIRAARDLRDASATGSTAIWGYSQGGHAALFAAELLSQEDQDLNIVGVVAAAAPTTARWVSDSLRDRDRFQFGLMGVVSLPARHPELQLDDVLTKAGLDVVDRVRDGEDGACPQVDVVLDGHSTTSLVKRRPMNVPAWAAALADAELPAKRAAVPVLVIQGASDRIIPVSEGRHALEALCAAGSVVEEREIPGGHLAAADPAAPLRWIRDRLRGVTPIDDCAAAGASAPRG